MRAWALRAMAGIRLHVIAPLVLVAVGKCARDPSVYVRKCAANALPKLHDLRLEEHTSAIEEVWSTCLSIIIIIVVVFSMIFFLWVCPFYMYFFPESPLGNTLELRICDRYFYVLLRFYLVWYGRMGSLQVEFINYNPPPFVQVVGLLLNDNTPGVVGAAASAFASVCPNNFALVGRNYRRLCEILPDVEEWGQIILIGILLRYVIARHGLVKESVMFSLCHEKDHGPGSSVSEDEPDFTLKEGIDHGFGKTMSGLANMIFQCYIEGPDEYLSRSSSPNAVPPKLDLSKFSSSSNDDVKILLQCTSPLLWSNNSAVVLAAVSVHWIMAPLKDIKKTVKPLMFVLRSSYASRYVVSLYSIHCCLYGLHISYLNSYFPEFVLFH